MGASASTACTDGGALYFLSVALGTAMAGKLAGYFLVIGLVAIAVGALVLAFTKPIRRLRAGVH